MHRRAVTDWNADFLDLSPLFAPLARMARRLRLDAWPTVEGLETLRVTVPPIVSGSGAACRFVAAQRGRRDYERCVFEAGEIQVRPNDWHDVFNALIWLTFPRAKSALNARHVQEMQKEPSGQRGRVRDALTQFDEDGVIVASSSTDLLRMVRESQWKPLFLDRREETVARMRFIVFGHALCHKALAPFIGMTGKAVLLEVSEDFLARLAMGRLAAVDQRLAGVLADASRLCTPQDLLPLPVLGVPGWYPGNAAPEFYNDALYFRSRDRASP